MQTKQLRNVAIIAHVDHGKTTLVDKILHTCELFQEHQVVGELILDNNDLERERGITIVSKNVAVNYKGTKINIIDTPGHADFGGEVERVLKMADGVLLLVDAFEGPMPQTRFVTQKALALGLKPIVVINKIDKENCQPELVYEQVFELFFHLDATEEQIDFPVLYGSSKQGWMSTDWKQPTQNMTTLLDVILECIPAPEVNPGALQLQITSLDYNSFVGRIAVGRVVRGLIRENMSVALIDRSGRLNRSRIKELYTFDGLGKVKVQQVSCGDICAVVGLETFNIGDTIADAEQPEVLPHIQVDEPTMNMLFTINNSPFYGKEGKFLTSGHLQNRLMKETEKNLALRVESTDSPEDFLVYGRGVLHLSILIEEMRREGYELQVGQPRVILKEIEGRKHEPIEILTIDLPEAYSGKIIELVTLRKGELLTMETKGDLQHLGFRIPARGMIGLRTHLLTASAGEAVISHRFDAYEPWKGEIPTRSLGVLISMDKGVTTAYRIDKLQDRGKFFIAPGESVYKGMIVGEHSRENDLTVNIIEGKQLTNFRTTSKDDAAKITPPVRFSLEEALEYIQSDEYVEVTPDNIRLRKIILKENERLTTQKRRSK
ncbi:MAG: translational GTPase TypA [Flavobacteriales bacterium AspAUS03]